MPQIPMQWEFSVTVRCLWRSKCNDDFKRIAVATPEPQTPGMSQPLHNTQEFATLVVKVTYSLKSPPDGIEFVLPNDNHPYVRLHIPFAL